MADIKIKVEGRIATNLTPEVKLVTKNDGYTVEFEFDETWSVSSLKTALFIANGHCIPVPFVGNICNVPMLVGVELLNVGVKSDDVLGLQTTTAAKVLCVLSADDLVVDEIPAPSQSVYDRIVEMINLGMIKGDKGDKGDKGEKGDAGAIKFITVVELPTENIDESAIYLVPIENPDGENRFTEYAYIDGKWETLGAISIQVDHSEYAKFTDFKIQNGFYSDGKNIYLASATKDEISAKGTSYKAISPYLLDHAFKVAATDNKEEWSAAERQKARALFMAVATTDSANAAQVAEKIRTDKFLTPYYIDKIVKVGITTNTETLTDEEKASACEWLGATPFPKQGQENGTFTVLMPDGTIKRAVLSYSNWPSVNGVPVYNTNKTIMVNNAVNDTDAPNWGQVKTYVDDLIAELRAEIAALKGE